MQLLSQRNGKWSGIRMDKTNDTIGNFGCGITCLAMLAGTTPDYVNSINPYAYEDIISWQKASQLLGLPFQGRSSSPTFYPCIAEVRMFGFQHFVIMTGHSIIDPWDGQEKASNTYTRIDYINITQKGSDMIPFKNAEEVISAYQKRLLRDPTGQEINYWVGKDTREFLVAVCEELLAPFKNRDEVISAYKKRLKREPAEDDIKYWIDKKTRDFLISACEELLKKLKECQNQPRDITEADNNLIEEFNIWQEKLNQ